MQIRERIDISMIVFSAGTIAMGLIKIVIIFLGLEAIQGYGNPAIRIIRKTIMMKTVPKKFIGRVYGSLETISYMARIALLGIYILIIKYTGSGILIAIQGIFVLAFVFVVIYSFRKMQIKAQPDKNPKRFYLSGYYQKHRLNSVPSFVSIIFQYLAYDSVGKLTGIHEFHTAALLLLIGIILTIIFRCRYHG